MKKVFTSIKYKRYNATHSKKAIRKLSAKHKHSLKEQLLRKKTLIQPTIRPQKLRHKGEVRVKYNNRPKLLQVPTDFRLLDNTQECLRFFNRLRSNKYVSYLKNQKREFVTLSQVQKIDYGAISIFKAIIDELYDKNIIVGGDFPNDQNCRRLIVHSGFLQHLVNEHNKPFNIDTKSDMLRFEKGAGKMTESDSILLSQTIKDVASDLSGVPTKCPMLKSLLLEICGNTIEWSSANNNRWQLGVIYDDDKVIFTVTDTGIGILGSLFSKFSKMLTGLSKDDKEILMGAFTQKYGSKSKDINRNQGLRLVKHFHDDKCLFSLKVLTNNVFLDFENESLSKEFSSIGPTFDGTFYQWTIDKQCISNINNNIWK